MMHRRMGWKIAVAALGAALALTAPALAVDDDSDMTMTIETLRILEISTTTLDFDPTETQMLAGFTDIQDVTATVTTNDDWVLRIYGSSSSWSGPWSKPRSHIEFKKSTESTYNELAASPGTQVDSGGPAFENETVINFRVKLNVAQDRPGDYTYTYVTYEISYP